MINRSRYHGIFYLKCYVCKSPLYLERVPQNLKKFPEIFPQILGVILEPRKYQHLLKFGIIIYENYFILCFFFTFAVFGINPPIHADRLGSSFIFTPKKIHGHLPILADRKTMGRKSPAANHKRIFGTRMYS